MPLVPCPSSPSHCCASGVTSMGKLLNFLPYYCPLEIFLSVGSFLVEVRAGLWAPTLLSIRGSMLGKCPDISCLRDFFPFSTKPVLIGGSYGL